MSRTAEDDSDAAALYAEALVWDHHGCLPFVVSESTVDSLELYRHAGVDFVSINVGFDLTSTDDTLKVLGAFRRGIRARPDRYALVSGTADIAKAREQGLLAVAFDLEGTEPLDGELSLLEVFHALGVRTALMTYNRRNRAGGGCHDDPEYGLTPYGRALLAEMNDLGILVDATHCSLRTSFDLCEFSTAPVIFSHSVPAGVHAHDRNVSDAQMSYCAETGGVIGVNGVGIFLGDNDNSTEALVRAVDYAVGVAGIDHVGLGLDYMFPLTETLVPGTMIELDGAQIEDYFPESGGYRTHLPRRLVSPLQLLDFTGELLTLGYSESDVRAVLGKNFERVAGQIWRSSEEEAATQ